MLFSTHQVYTDWAFVFSHGRSLNASGIHHSILSGSSSSFLWSASESTQQQLEHAPSSLTACLCRCLCRCLDVLQQYQNYKSVLDTGTNVPVLYPVDIHIWAFCAPLFVFQTSGTNSFDIQKKFNNLLSVAASGPLPGPFSMLACFLFLPFSTPSSFGFHLAVSSQCTHRLLLICLGRPPRFSSVWPPLLAGFAPGPTSKSESYQN